MKLIELDLETRAVLVWVSIYLKLPTLGNMAKLASAYKRFESLHSEEMLQNLLRGLSENTR